jgi:hypothetical protein
MTVSSPSGLTPSRKAARATRGLLNQEPPRTSL